MKFGITKNTKSKKHERHEKNPNFSFRALRAFAIQRMLQHKLNLYIKVILQ